MKVFSDLSPLQYVEGLFLPCHLNYTMKVFFCLVSLQYDRDIFLSCHLYNMMKIFVCLVTFTILRISFSSMSPLWYNDYVFIKLSFYWLTLEGASTCLISLGETCLYISQADYSISRTDLLKNITLCLFERSSPLEKRCSTLVKK